MKVFDAHLHIIDPRFPLVPNNGYLPEPFTSRDYLRATDGVERAGGAVVAGSFQGFDRQALLSAVGELGPGFVAVIHLPPDVTDAEIRALDSAGVRAVRFNVCRLGSGQLAQLETVARRVHELARWHVELYVDAKDLAAIEDRVAALPAVSIDHLGLSCGGLPVLCRMAERGVRVKATGFGRVDFDVVAAMRALWSANPDCLMFGTDVPSTRAPRPYSPADLQLMLDSFDDAQVEKILCGNARQFYRLDYEPRSR